MVGAYLVPGSAERTAGRAGHLHVCYFSVSSEGVFCLAPPRPVASGVWKSTWKATRFPNCKEVLRFHPTIPGALV